MEPRRQVYKRQSSLRCKKSCTCWAVCSRGSPPMRGMKTMCPCSGAATDPEARSKDQGKEALASQVWTGWQRESTDSRSRQWALSSLLSATVSREPVPGWRPCSTHGRDAQHGAKCFQHTLFSILEPLTKNLCVCWDQKKAACP